MSDTAVADAPPPVTLRPYQAECVRALADTFLMNKTITRGVVALPTASGKTVTAGYFITRCFRKLTLRTVVIAHREELLNQFEEKIRKLDAGIKITRWDANQKDASGDVILASILSTKGLAAAMESLYGPNFQGFMSIVDEAHHFAQAEEKTKGKRAYKNEYARLDTEFRQHGLVRFWVGLTATPTRLDGRALDYEAIVYRKSFMELVQQGWLAQPVYHEKRTKQSFVLDELEKDGKRDYTDKSLEKLNNQKRNQQIAQEYVNKKDTYGKTLMFAVNVAHAYKLAEELRKLDPNLPIRVIDGKISETDRKDFITWFGEGSHMTPKVAINCLVYTEGVDEPTINTVFLTRPTKSKGLWMQMVGRGARIIVLPDGTRVKTRFNLVSIMDDIGHYGVLVEDWLEEVCPEADTEAKRIIKKQSVHAKRRLIQRVLELDEEKPVELEDAKVIEVQAVLRCCTKKTRPQGIALDKPRLDCLFLLKEFVNDLGNRSNFMMEKFKTSFTSCVQNNEFPPAVWRNIAWAYYFKYVAGQEKIRCEKAHGKMCTTWEILPIVPVEEFAGEQAKKEAAERLKEIRETAAKRNDEFNARYGGSQGTKDLYEQIVSQLFEVEKKGPVLKRFLQRAGRVTARDRIVEVKLVDSISEQWELSTVGFANVEGTKVLQEILDDSAVEFRISPAYGKN